MSHHHNAVYTGGTGGRWEIVRPMRDSSWWHRRKKERACAKTSGHCWHPDGYTTTGWWCCMCSGETEGLPPQNCRHCKEGDHGNSASS